MTAFLSSDNMAYLHEPIIHTCTYSNCIMKSTWKIKKKIGSIIIYTYSCDYHHEEVKKLLEQIKSPVTEEGFNDAETTA